MRCAALNAVKRSKRSKFVSSVRSAEEKREVTDEEGVQQKNTFFWGDDKELCEFVLALIRKPKQRREKHEGK